MEYEKINSYFGYQINLPAEYTLTKRESLVISTVSNEDEDVVAVSNDEELMQKLADASNTLMAKSVFIADDGTHFINILNQSPKVNLMADDDSVWDEESVIAEYSLC